MATLGQEVGSLGEQLKTVTVNKEDVDKFQRWNSLLVMEVEQKTERIDRVEQVEQRCRSLLTENKALKTEVGSNRGQVLESWDPTECLRTSA